MPSRSVHKINNKGQRIESGNTFSFTGPAAASTPVVEDTAINLSRYDAMLVHLVGSTALGGGVCDYVLQRTVDGPAGTTWDDYLYLGQQAAGTAINIVAFVDPSYLSAYSADKGDATWVLHDFNTDATLVLTSGERRPGHWGERLRLIARSGAGVNAGAVVTVDIVMFSEP